MSPFVRFALLTVVLGSGACTGSDPDANLGLADDPLVDGKDDSVARPHGTYAGGAGSTMNWLRLATDASYWFESPVDAAIGSFHYAKSGNHRYLVLDDEAGHAFQSFEYRLSGKDLLLRQTHQSEWETYEHTGAAGEACFVDPDTSDYACEKSLHCVPHGNCER